MRKWERIRPDRLRAGDTIGIIAPASPQIPEMLPETLQRMIGVFAAYGYTVKLGRTVTEQRGYLAGDDAMRAADVQQMFADPEVKAIICLRGGYGTPRILDRLDYEEIRKHPKIFVGYSDITALLTTIFQRTGLITFHGPMVAALTGEEPDLYSLEMLFRVISDPDSAATLRYGQMEGEWSETFRSGCADGALIGGNLSMLTSTLGTPFEVDVRGRVFFIEEVGEQPYAIDRMLTQLRLSGKLEQANGIVFTDFARCEPKEEGSTTYEQVLREFASALDIPVYFGLKVGHCKPNLTLPIGVRARMNATERWVELAEGAVQ